MNDDSNWLARAGIEHRVAAMYEEALRRIAETEEINGNVSIAREALSRAVEVGQRAVVEFDASREQLIKMRHDTIEECAQLIEHYQGKIFDGLNLVRKIRDLAPASESGK